jgi:prepilin-type N-terminal cleavage/methylation domain-containing protein
MNKAFTLAEVLVVIGIIGVVAAITMPVLMNYISGSYITRARVGYYDVLKLVRGIESDLGTYEDWEPMNTQKFCDEYIAPRLNYTKAIARDNYDYTGVYPILNGNRYIGCMYQLTNGSVLMFNAYTSNDAVIVFDTNGQAEPNTHGVDVWRMYLCTDPAGCGWSGPQYFGFKPADDVRMNAGSESADNCAYCRKVIVTNYTHNLTGPYTDGSRGCLACLVEHNFDAGKYPIKQWGAP